MSDNLEIRIDALEAEILNLKVRVSNLESDGHTTPLTAPRQTQQSATNPIQAFNLFHNKRKPGDDGAPVVVRN